MSTFFLCLLPLPARTRGASGPMPPCIHPPSIWLFTQPTRVSQQPDKPYHTPLSARHPPFSGGAEPAKPFRVSACVRSYLHKHMSLNA
ncbi:hypothetical protein BC567DRAFT_235167 [Phyllosticta citribraziliensis]